MFNSCLRLYDKVHNSQRYVNCDCLAVPIGLPFGPKRTERAAFVEGINRISKFPGLSQVGCQQRLEIMHSRLDNGVTARGSGGVGGGVGGPKWVAPLLPADFEAPIHYRWPEYVSTARGEEWWVPEKA